MIAGIGADFVYLKNTMLPVLSSAEAGQASRTQDRDDHNRQSTIPQIPLLIRFRDVPLSGLVLRESPPDSPVGLLGARRPEASACSVVAT